MSTPSRLDGGLSRFNPYYQTDVKTTKNLVFRSGTAYELTLDHALTGAKTIQFPDASGVVVLDIATQELDNKTLDSSVGKGTWTASGTWTLPAVTLGGQVDFTGTPILANGTYLQLKEATGTAVNVLGIAAAGNRVRLTSSADVIEIQPDIAQDAYFWGGSLTAGTGRILALYGTASSAGATIKNSPTLRLAAWYWNGGANTLREGEIIHSMTATTPNSALLFKVAGVQVIEMRNNNGTLTATCAGNLGVASGQVFTVNSVQVVGARVVDARCDDAIAGAGAYDDTTAGVIDALRDAMIAHGLIAAA